MQHLPSPVAVGTVRVNRTAVSLFMQKPDATLILADVQNIYYTCRQAYGRNFDYNALWRQVSEDGEIVKAIAYAIERGDDKQRQFQNILRAIGFEVRLKPFIQRADGSAKGDWDVGITLDAMEWAPRVKRVVLLSGDGDFALLVDSLRHKHGVRVEAYGAPALTAKALIDAVDQFVAIDQSLLL